ncbi:MAG: T9SS C-terminal target domain-containing protein [Ignavibacteriae bacterium]|nr:MAG: T9SS C-terminal target domain-containing protein [Ignavibacteriota bacterium]
MSKFINGFLFLVVSLALSSTSVFSQSQNLIIDSFGDHKLPGWYWGGNLNMKYSHETDNLENGYAEILALDQKVSPNTFLGLIRKEQKIQIVQDNILSLMLQGVSNDINVTIQILFDKNKDTKYDEKSDTRLESKPISLNFSGWKEIHLNINESEFSIISKLIGEDFSILEEEAMGLQITYQTGKQFVTGKVETGIALVAERPNKEVKQENANNEDVSSGESYYSTKNYPNPFNPETNITYTLRNSTNVKITVYDRLGREIVVLVDEAQGEGEHTIKFNASNLPSGIYFYRIKTPEKVEVRKMVFAK